jgi:hypothetical protein
MQFKVMSDSLHLTIALPIMTNRSLSGNEFYWGASDLFLAK